MGPKRFKRQSFSLFLIKFKKLEFSAPLSRIYQWRPLFTGFFRLERTFIFAKFGKSNQVFLNLLLKFGKWQKRYVSKWKNIWTNFCLSFPLTKTDFSPTALAMGETSTRGYKAQPLYLRCWELIIPVRYYILQTNWKIVLVLVAITSELRNIILTKTLT